MYVLQLLVFLLVNGAPSDEPLLTLQNNEVRFTSEEQCEGYFDTDEGKLSKEQAFAMIAEHMKGKAYAVGVTCEKKQGEEI
jgi:hypothetical protein